MRVREDGGMMGSLRRLRRPIMFIASLMALLFMSGRFCAAKRERAAASRAAAAEEPRPGSGAGAGAPAGVEPSP